MKTLKILMISTKKTVLLVEDDADLQLLIKEAIEKVSNALFIQVVEDGAEAICYLTGQELYADRKQYPLPALIVTDLQMPRVNGIELLTWVKRQNDLNHLPVIMMSTSDNPDFVNQAIDLGAKSYASKTSLHKLAMQVFKTVIEQQAY